MEQAKMIHEINWQIDPEASKIEFRIRHMLSYISGIFRDYTLEVITQGENFATVWIRFGAKLLSADINDEERESQINSLELLYDEKYALFQFNSTRVEKISEHRFAVFGNLRLFDVERPIVLDLVLDGLTRTPGDHLSAAFSLMGKLKYTDFTDSIEELKSAPLFVGKEVALTVKAKLQKPGERNSSLQ